LEHAVERPDLVLYPLKSLDFLETEEFKSIPVHHDTVPAPSHSIFDVADFDTRYYEHVQTYEGLEGKGAEPGIHFPLKWPVLTFRDQLDVRN
jgi:hypothetical protein